MADQAAPDIPPAPAPPATDEVTPYDLHGPGQCGHVGCRKEGAGRG